MQNVWIFENNKLILPLKQQQTTIKQIAIMTQQEFIERTGLHPTDEKFKTIHEMYMLCSTLDKDEFCQDYKKHGSSMIIYDLLETIEAKTKSYNDVFDAYEAYRKDIINKELTIAQFLLSKATALNDPDFEREALRLVSRNTIILIKIKNQYPLSQEDFEYIANNLK